MATLSLSFTFTAPPDTVWALAGDFAGLHHWHPWVADCRMDPDGRTRRIGQGALEAVEVLESRTESEMTYTVQKSPMPIRDYRCTWRVHGDATSSVVTVEATYLPDGVPEEVASGMLSGFFTEAFSAIAARV